MYTVKNEVLINTPLGKCYF